jgi:hypothetical protein
MSLAKVAAALYAMMGLLAGCIFSLITVLGGALAPNDAPGGVFGMLFGVAAIVVLPIFYGVMGFVMSLIGAALYNVAASSLGGVEVDLQ